MSCTLFPGSQILSLASSSPSGEVRVINLFNPTVIKFLSFGFKDKSSYQRILNEWYGNPKQQWRLIFRASAHNFSAQAFHRICDGIAPTYTIVAVRF